MAPSINWGRSLLLLRSSKVGPCSTTASVVAENPAIPREYTNYTNLIDKEAADALPAHQEGDHCIPVEKGKASLYGPMYGLTPTKVEALKRK